MLVQTSWDGLRDKAIGMVQVFYKERAALGYVALEPQLTVLICTGSSLLSGFWQPAVALTLINPSHCTCFSAHINNQLALALHSNNVGQSHICRKYVIQEWRRKKVNFSFILFSIENGLPNPAGNDTPMTVWAFNFVKKKQNSENENYQCFTHWQGQMESREKGLGI